MRNEPSTLAAMLKADEQLTAKLLALGVRNGVEDLHAAGCFDDSQAPLFNRTVRARILEALLALEFAGGDRQSTAEAAIGWLGGHADLAEEDPLLGLLPSAVAGAIDSFCEGIGSTAPEREDLHRAAREGLEQTICLYKDAIAGKPQARESMGLLAQMIPDYWEDAEPREDFLRGS
jgi:hypothetical protein